MVKKEVGIQRTLYHRNVVILFEVLDDFGVDSDHIGLVLELCAFGASMDYVSADCRFQAGAHGRQAIDWAAHAVDPIAAGEAAAAGAGAAAAAAAAAGAGAAAAAAAGGGPASEGKGATEAAAGAEAAAEDGAAVEAVRAARASKALAGALPPTLAASYFRDLMRVSARGYEPS
jgi:hypothetical protein